MLTRSFGGRFTPCCDTRHLLLRNEAATSEIIPALCVRRTKLISNQLGLHVVYTLMFPSRRMIKLPLHYNTPRQVISGISLTASPKERYGNPPNGCMTPALIFG
jgi:hypothetical protein